MHNDDKLFRRRHPFWFINVYGRLRSVLREMRARRNLNRAVVEGKEVDFNKERAQIEHERSGELRKYGMILNLEQREAAVIASNFVKDWQLKAMIRAGYLCRDGLFRINNAKEIAICIVLVLLVILIVQWSIVVVSVVWSQEARLALRISAVLVGTMPALIPGVVFAKVVTDPLLAYLRLPAFLKP